MFRLLKYTKPYLPMILLAVVLLFAQANFDLALPDYLSRIVNVGIQQGGVEEALPEAVRQSTMDNLVLFMTAEDKNGCAGCLHPGRTFLGSGCRLCGEVSGVWRANRFMCLCNPVSEAD